MVINGRMTKRSKRYIRPVSCSVFCMRFIVHSLTGKELEGNLGKIRSNKEHIRKELGSGILLERNWTETG